jgi:hypothetical protein
MSHEAKISLACVDSDYLGLLFKGETDVTYSNQVGGTCCSHPIVEGFFVLLGGMGPEESEDPFFDHGPTTYRAEHKERVTALLAALGLDQALEAPEVHEVQEEWWGEVCEAWIPIKVKEDATGFNADPVENLKGRVGILTYPNSD